MAQVDSNNNRPVAPAPLLCWDFFMEGYQRLMKKGGDIQEIRRLATSLQWEEKWDYQNELVNQDKVIVITDPRRVIVFASHNIVEMTGYYPAELKGQTPKIFQGEKTDNEVSAYIRTRLQHQLDFEATVINYKKIGNPYNCHIKGFPIFNKKAALVNYIAFEKAA